MTTTEAEVLSLIDVDDLVDVAQRLIRARGENPPGGEAATVDVLASVCRERGLHVTLDDVNPHRQNLTARLPGGGGPGLLLLGHTDVVPVGEGWSVDPFGGAVIDGRLHGRGSADMKGGLAACVVAMDALGRAGAPLRGPVDLAALVDEEEHGAGIRHYVTTDPAGFVGCIVAEPTDLQSVIAARGDAYVEITIHGAAAHSGRPDDGSNAIYGAAAVITSLEQWHADLAAAAHPLVGPATWSVGIVEGGQGTSIVPARCRVSADRRLLPGESAPDVLAAVRERLDRLDLSRRGLRVEVEMPMDMPGFETAPDHPFVAAVDGSVRSAGGPVLPLGGWTAACDGGFVARDLGVPTLVLGPGSVNDQAHRANESVAVIDLLTAARAYALSALRTLS